MMDLNLSRRDMLKLTATGAGAMALSGWMPVLASRAAAAQQQAAQTGQPAVRRNSAANSVTKPFHSAAARGGA